MEGECHESRRQGPRCLGFLERQLRRGLPGVYEAVISGHRESPPVQRIRRNEAPEVTGGDSSRQLPITRNEGVPGSSPGVGLKVPAQKPLVFSIWETHEVLQTDLRFRAMAFCSFFASLAGRRSRSVEGRAPRARGAQAGRSHASRRPRRQGQSVRPSVQEPDGEQRAGGRYRLAPRGVAPCVRTGLPLVVRGERVEDTHADSRFPGRGAIADAYLVGYARAS